MPTPLQQILTNQFPTWPFQFDLSLAQKTYFKVGGPAEAYIDLEDHQQVAELLAWCFKNEVQVTLFGGASNVVVADEGVPGVVLHIADSHVDVQGTLLVCGAGLQTALVVKSSVDAGLTGLELFLGVPGTIGGAVYNNAHYLEDLIGAFVSRVKVCSMQGEIYWLSQAECEFGYDTSRFHTSGEVLLEIEFSLQPGTKESSREEVIRASQYRAKTQPLGEPSSGCIFQNVPNTPELQQLFPQFAQKAFVPGGFLIDQAGLKNQHEGDIYVSDKHAAFFVNKGSGSAAQVKKLIERVKQTVQEKFGVVLQEEVFYLPKKVQ